MRKTPKKWLLVSLGLLVASLSCNKNEIAPDTLEFVCQGDEKTIQTFVDVEAIVRKITVNRRNLKQQNASKSDFLYSDNIYVLTIKDSQNANQYTNLVPSIPLSDNFKVDSLPVKFSGEKKNCTFSTNPLPNIDYLPTIDFIIGNKIILTAIQK